MKVEQTAGMLTGPMSKSASRRRKLQDTERESRAAADDAVDTHISDLQMADRTMKGSANLGPAETDAMSPVGCMPSEAVRTTVSLLLFMHLFCLVVVLSSSFLPSELQRRLVSVVAPYTKSLHLDPNFLPFQLTNGEDGLTRMHQWQVVRNGTITHRFPSQAVPGGFNRDRLDMYARVGAFYATDSDSEIPAAMARGIANHVLGQQDTAQPVVVRCVRYFDDGDYATTPLDSPAMSVIYAADVWIAESGEINLLKQLDPRRAAPPIETASDPAGVAK